MSVVRDPGAAAAYAANPAQAIADAHLTDVTSVDVNNLIPVVSESLSSAVPSGGFAGSSVGADTLGDAAHNVWASGAATAAFDAFGDHLPLQGGDVVADHVPLVSNVIDQPVDPAPVIVDHVIDDGVPSVAAPSDPGLAIDAPGVEDVHAFDTGTAGGDVFDAGHQAIDDHLDHAQDPGFDIFT